MTKYAGKSAVAVALWALCFGCADNQQPNTSDGSPASGAGGGGMASAAGGGGGSTAGMSGSPAGGGSGAGGAGAGGSGAGGGGAAGAAGSSGAGAGGAAGTEGGAGAGGDAGPGNPMQVDPVGNANRAPGYIDLSPPMGEPLPSEGAPAPTPPPAGWTWHLIDGAVCRDGSPTGFYVRQGAGDGLLIYLEGGGACSNGNYCSFNPANVDQLLAGDGEVVIGSALGAGPGRQQPGAYTDAFHAGPPAGIFDTANAQNPFADWSMVYVPYCTGDVHFGTRRDAMVPNDPLPQQFVGYFNMQKFIGRIVPTFQDRVARVVLTGASAGGFGAALNFSMVQDAFGDTPVSVIDDSGPPFTDRYMPVCMQRRWRDAWGLDAALPPDCEDCFQADGGSLINLADFLIEKHPVAKIALISSMQDEVIRLFYSVGLVDCANYDTADPVAVVLLQADPTVFFPGDQYQAGLMELRSRYESTGRFATYFLGGANVVFHQHLFRPRFYDASAGTQSIAQFVSDFLDGTVAHIGP